MIFSMEPWGTQREVEKETGLQLARFQIKKFWMKAVVIKINSSKLKKYLFLSKQKKNLSTQFFHIVFFIYYSNLRDEK